MKGRRRRSFVPTPQQSAVRCGENRPRQVSGSGSGSQCGQRRDWDSGSEWQGGPLFLSGAPGPAALSRAWGAGGSLCPWPSRPPLAGVLSFIHYQWRSGRRAAPRPTCSPPPSGDRADSASRRRVHAARCPRRFGLWLGLGPGGRASSASTYLLPVELTAVFVS